VLQPHSISSSGGAMQQQRVPRVSPTQPVPHHRSSSIRGRAGPLQAFRGEGPAGGVRAVAWCVTKSHNTPMQAHAAHRSCRAHARRRLGQRQRQEQQRRWRAAPARPQPCRGCAAGAGHAKQPAGPAAAGAGGGGHRACGVPRDSGAGALLLLLLCVCVCVCVRGCGVVCVVRAEVRTQGASCWGEG
jgi:hypothetical protein